MTRICKKCNNSIIELSLSEEQKLDLWSSISQGLHVVAAKVLMDLNGLNSEDANIIIAHLNKEYGKCCNCDFDQLDDENIECPECGAFNYNLRWPVFDSKFCLHLEYSLDFNKIKRKELWCDGIQHAPTDLKSLCVKNLEQQKKLVVIAYIGEHGEQEYEMTIHFGPRSIENYKNGLNLIDCIYTDNYDRWIKVEPENKKIEVWLK